MKGPAWLYEVAKDSALNARDLREMFGISVDVLNKQIAQGLFPESDYRLKYKNRREWYVRTIIKHLRTLPG